MISIVSARYEDLSTLADITQQSYGSTALNQAGLERSLKIQADGFFVSNYNARAFTKQRILPRENLAP